jgi:hypothetical protein
MLRAAMVPAALVLLAAAPPPEPPRFASQVELVTVDAVVVDRTGAPVRGLTADDFLLYEDGQLQTVASFEAIDVAQAAPRPRPPIARVVASNEGERPLAGRSFVLLVDDMSLTPGREHDVRRAIARLLNQELRDGDELIFATSSQNVWWTAQMPDGREDVMALAGRLLGRRLLDNRADAISEWEAFRITHYEGIEDGGGGGPGGPIAPMPTGAPGPTAAMSPIIPGSNITERIRQRFLQRGVCHERQPPAACYVMVRSRAQQIDAVRRNRTRDVLSVVDRAVFALTGVRGRKSLLLLTEGFLSDSELGVVQEVAGRCREANIAVYAIDVRGLIAAGESASDAFDPPPFPTETALMRTEQVEFAFAGSVGLAEDTGGFALRNTNDLEGGTVRAAAESRVHYLLAYAPPPGKSPLDWRRVRVEVKRPGLTVRARKGYTLRNAADIAAAEEAKLAAGRGQAPPLPVDVARAMTSGHEDGAVPLRAAAYVLEDRPGGLVKTLIAVEAGVGALANLGGDDKPRAALSLAITAVHRDTGRIAHAVEMAQVEAQDRNAWDGWLVLSRALDLSPGVNQARVVVRDEFLGRLGAVTLRFEVPQPGTFRLSSPMLTDRVMPTSAGAPARPALVARREFPAGRQVFCQYEVLGVRPTPATVIESLVELRSSDGVAVRQALPGPIPPLPDGRLVRLLAFPLAGLRPGDYTMVIRASDRATGRATERSEPFRIVPPRILSRGSEPPVLDGPPLRD